MGLVKAGNNLIKFGSGGFFSLPSEVLDVYPENVEIITMSEMSEDVIYQSGDTYVKKTVTGDSYTIQISTDSGSTFNDLYSISGQSSNFRFGVRDGYYYIDCEITATGFAGTEDVDWEWLNRYRIESTAGTLYREGIFSGGYEIQQWNDPDWITILRLS